MNIPVVMRGFIVPTVVLLAALAMMAIEAMQAGRKWPKVRGWWLRALLLNGVQVGAVWIAGVGWNGWMVRHRPWNANAIGTFGGAIAGYVAITFFYYWWHRWRHQSNFLWRLPCRERPANSGWAASAKGLSPPSGSGPGPEALVYSFSKEGE